MNVGHAITEAMQAEMSRDLFDRAHYYEMELRGGPGDGLKISVPLAGPGGGIVCPMIDADGCYSQLRFDHKGQFVEETT